MARFALPLTLIAVATLSACSSTAPQTGSPTSAAPQVVTQVHPYLPGNGVVQRVMPAPAMAGAGSTGAPLQRLEIRMDNGAIQYVDTTSTELPRGSRITLTPDHQIRRL